MNTNRTLTDVKKRYQELELNLQNPNTSLNAKKLKELGKEYADLKEIIGIGDEIAAIEKNIADLELAAVNETDKEIKNLADEEIVEQTSALKMRKAEMEALLTPDDPLDKKDIIIEIRAGAGGDEAALFAADLFRMYCRFAEKNNWASSILSANRIGIGGFKEVILEISGKNVYKTLKYESGVHRVQRIPETEKSGRVHTSTATVAILPEASEVDIAIKPEDVKVEANTSTGHGGQSVNTTYSAIRLTHIPTGIVINCQDERSQTQNKEKAFTILRSRLFQMEQEKMQKERSSQRKEQIGSGDRSEKIRTYNFPQDRVTDHRIKQNWNQITKVMDGNLAQIVSAIKEYQNSL